MSSIKFELDEKDVEKLTEKIKSFSGDAERAINDYLRDIAAPSFDKAIENLLPISENGKSHAKGSDPFENEFFNMGVNVKSKKEFWYLYFPDQGDGTSLNRGARFFMQKGIDAEYGNTVNGMLDAMMSKFKEE